MGILNEVTFQLMSLQSSICKYDGHSVENEKKEGNESQADWSRFWTLDSGLDFLDLSPTEGRDGDRMDIAFFADFKLVHALVSIFNSSGFVLAHVFVSLMVISSLLSNRQNKGRDQKNGYL